MGKNCRKVDVCQTMEYLWKFTPETGTSVSLQSGEQGDQGTGRRAFRISASAPVGFGPRAGHDLRELIQNSPGEAPASRLRIHRVSAWRHTRGAGKNQGRTIPASHPELSAGPSASYHSPTRVRVLQRISTSRVDRGRRGEMYGQRSAHTARKWRCPTTCRVQA